MKRGFTLVEVLIVVAVLTILTAISVLAYDETQKRADDGAARAAASTLVSGLEKYYASNNEYPLASLVQGAAVNGSIPASYTSASQVLNIPKNTLDTAKFKLIACTAAVAACKTDALNKTNVYYYTKATQTSAANEVVTSTAGGGSCAYTFAASDIGALGYLVIYFNSTKNVLDVVRSNNGAVTSSNNTTCPFTAL